MLIYFDASTLVKRYSHENGTALVNEAFVHIPCTHMTCSSIGMLEVLSILVRKRNDGRIIHMVFEQAMHLYKTEVIANPSFLTIPATDALVHSAMDLIPKHNINATDAIVLRSALRMKSNLQRIGGTITLWTSDKRLYRASQQEGLSVFDPEQETMTSLHAVLGIS